MHTPVDERHVVLLLRLREDLDANAGLHLLALHNRQHSCFLFQRGEDFGLGVLRLVVFLLRDEVGVVRRE